MRISPEERFWARVDKSGECWHWAGSTTGGYGQFYARGKSIYAHRFSFELAHGTIPEGLFVDHVCHQRACVNPDHLRLATTKQNGENLSGARSASGIRGVYWHPKARKWAGRVQHDGVNYGVGHFSDLAEAEAAIIAKRNELFTHNDLDRSNGPS